MTAGFKILFSFFVLLGLTCNSGRNKEQNAQKPAIIFAEPSGRLLEDLSNDNFNWILMTTRHFRIYHEQNSYAAEHIDYLMQKAEESVDRALEIINRQSYESGINLILVDSKEKMYTLTGLRVKGFAPIGTDRIYLVYNEDIRPYLDHEIMHKVSIALLGEPPTWLREGSAMYADGTCLHYDDPISVLSAYLLSENMLIPVEDLVTRFDDYTRQNDMITYLQSASLFKYIYETNGWDKIESLWKSEPGMFPEIMGKSFNQFEKDWHSHLKTIDITGAEVDWPELMDKGCG